MRGPKLQRAWILAAYPAWAFLAFGYTALKGAGCPSGWAFGIGMLALAILLPHALRRPNQLPGGLWRLLGAGASALAWASITLSWKEFWAGFTDSYLQASGHGRLPATIIQSLDMLALALLLTLALWLYARRSDQAEQERQRAEALKDQALRAKLAPHFIFNTLNTLKAQIAADPTAAEATTDRLAALFRQVVQVADQPTIPLKQELAFVEAYLGIERARLGDRLAVVMDIPEDLEDLPVPPLALQVLVENAVKHGVAPREDGGQIHIRAVDQRPEGLWLEVTDPGDGTAPTPSGTGTALSTLRQRLARPEDLSLEPTPQGFRASLLWRRPQTRNLA